MITVPFEGFYIARSTYSLHLSFVKFNCREMSAIPNSEKYLSEKVHILYLRMAKVWKYKESCFFLMQCKTFPKRFTDLFIFSQKDSMSSYLQRALIWNALPWNCHNILSPILCTIFRQFNLNFFLPACRWLRAIACWCLLH